MSKFAPAFAAACSLLLCATPATAQSLSGAAREARLAELLQMATGGEDVPLPVQAAELDAALERNDLPALRSLMAVRSGDEGHRMFNWQKAAVMKGAPFAVSYFYATDLWNVAEGLERSAARDPAKAEAMLGQAHNFKKSSLVLGLHAVALIWVDGQRCSDPAASAKHLVDMTLTMDVFWAFGRSLSLEERRQLIAQAMRLEEQTASVRQPDGWLCASEIAQLNAMAASTAQPKAVEDPNTPGRDMTIEIGARDLVVTDEVWWSRRDFARTMALAGIAAQLDVGFSPALAE